MSDSVAIALLAPDLTISPQLNTLSAHFGDTINLDWTVANVGDGPTTQDVVDRVWLSSDSLLDADDILLATVDALSLPLAAGGEYVQDDFLVNLPLDTELIEGDFYLLFATDVAASQAEWLEDNNQAWSVLWRSRFRTCPTCRSLIYRLSSRRHSRARR